MAVMRYVYHYHAQFSARQGEPFTAHIDGVSSSSAPILTMDDYRRIKKAIAQDLYDRQGHPCDPERLIITSMSLLHATE